MVKRKLLLLIGLVALLLALSLAAPVSADTNRYVDPGGACAGFSPCYTTISAAVAASVSGDIIYVFPGTYAESVDLSNMATLGNITLIAVGASGPPTPGTATIDPSTGPAIFNLTSPFPGNVTIDGFNVTSPDDDGIHLEVDSDVVIARVTANNANDDGMDISSDTGSVTVTSSSADGNTEDGFYIAADGNVTITDCSAYGNTEDGFYINGTNVTINTSSANGNEVDGFDIDARGDVSINPSSADGNVEYGFYINADGNVTITDCSAYGNTEDGFYINADGDVTINTSSADENKDDGFTIGADGDVSITDSSANENANNGFYIKRGGSVTISGSSADGNGYDGFYFYIGPIGNVTISGSSADGNGEDGFDIAADGDVTITGSSARDNVCGVSLGQLFDGNTFMVNGSIICNNTNSGLRLASNVVVNAEGNWWGDASGPSHPTNPGSTGDAIIDGSSGGSGTVDFTPWIDTISHSATVDPVKVGQLTTVSFQFSGGGGAVFLGLGPGDPNGTPPFTLSTDNGSLIDTDETGSTVHEFINKPNGVLSVTLVPDNAGTATVTLNGPCNLDDSIPVTVEAAPPPPPPPTVGGEAVGGEAYPVNKGTILAPWLALLAAVIAGATMALRRRKAQS